MATAAHQEGAATPQSGGRALVPFVARAAAAASSPRRGVPLRAALLAIVAGLAAGTGAVGAYQARHRLSWLRAGGPDATAAAMHRLEDQVARLQGSVEALRVADTPRTDPWHGLKQSVDALKQDVEQVRAAGAATAAQLSAKIDKTDHDPLPKLADITARLDRIEHEGPSRPGDGSPQKLAELSGRLDRLEKQGSSTPGALAPAASRSAAPAAVSSLHPDVTKVPVTPATAAAAETPPAAVAGWVLRDVYDGVALVQGRNGGLREVEPGEFLPGAGEIRSIERHGRAWVVLTTRGVIAAN